MPMSFLPVSLPAEANLADAPIGVALDVIYSRRVGLLSADSAEQVLCLLETLGYDLFVADLVRENARQELLVLEGLEEFREHLGGTLAGLAVAGWLAPRGLAPMIAMITQPVS